MKKRLAIIAQRVAEELIKLMQNQVTDIYCYRASRLIQRFEPKAAGKTVVLIAHRVLKLLARTGVHAYIRRTSYVSICISKRKVLNNTAHS